MDASVYHIWIVESLHPAASRIMTGSLLSEQLNVPLGQVTSFLDLFRAFHGTGLELLSFILDLLVQAVKDRENVGLEVPLGFYVGICQALTVVSRNLAQGQIALPVCLISDSQTSPQHLPSSGRNGGLLSRGFGLPLTVSLPFDAQFPAADLEDLLIFLSSGLMQLFCCAYVLLQISNHMLPGLQAFC